MQYKTGLVVGKFSPLHKGHEYLIETAKSKCDRVLLLSYSNPEFKGCEAKMRLKWLSELAPLEDILVLGKDDDVPDNNASDEVQRAFTARLCKSYFNLAPEAVFTSEAYGDGFADFLSAYFNRSVHHICVDMSRKEVPISGTELRANLFKNRKFLSPSVYPDFVKTVCFLGAESTGKSTLSRQCAKLFNTESVSEYGRTLWEEKDGVLLFDDFMKIAKTHIQHEKAAVLNSREYLFVDTSPLTTLFYCQSYFGKADAELNDLSTRSYDHLFLCKPDFPLVQDGTRQDENFRRRQNEWYTKALADRKMPYMELTGSLDDKIRTVQNTIGAI